MATPGTFRERLFSGIRRQRQHQQPTNPSPCLAPDDPAGSSENAPFPTKQAAAAASSSSQFRTRRPRSRSLSLSARRPLQPTQQPWHRQHDPLQKLRRRVQTAVVLEAAAALRLGSHLAPPATPTQGCRIAWAWPGSGLVAGDELQAINGVSVATLSPPMVQRHLSDAAATTGTVLLHVHRELQPAVAVARGRPAQRSSRGRLSQRKATALEEKQNSAEALVETRQPRRHRSLTPTSTCPGSPDAVVANHTRNSPGRQQQFHRSSSPTPSSSLALTSISPSSGPAAASASPPTTAPSPDSARLVTVCVTRGSHGLGMRIGADQSGVGAWVASLQPGGAVDVTGGVRKGDQLVAINGEPVECLAHEQIVARLCAPSDTNTITLALRRVGPTPTPSPTPSPASRLLESSGSSFASTAASPSSPETEESLSPSAISGRSQSLCEVQPPPVLPPGSPAITSGEVLRRVVLRRSAAGRDLQLGLRRVGGHQFVCVATVQPGSPAQHCGVRPGDCIRAIDGRNVSSSSRAAVARLLAAESSATPLRRGGQTPAGTVAEIVVSRGRDGPNIESGAGAAPLGGGGMLPGAISSPGMSPIAAASDAAVAARPPAMCSPMIVVTGPSPSPTVSPANSPEPLSFRSSGESPSSSSTSSATPTPDSPSSASPGKPRPSQLLRLTLPAASGEDLGLTLRQISPDNRNACRRIEVASVRDGSFAERAGFRSGDRLLLLETRNVELLDLQGVLLALRHAPTKVGVLVRRYLSGPEAGNGSGNGDDDNATPTASPLPAPLWTGPSNSCEEFEAMLQPLPTEPADERPKNPYGLELVGREGCPGAWIRSVGPAALVQSPAAASLRPGDRLLRWGEAELLQLSCRQVRALLRISAGPQLLVVRRRRLQLSAELARWDAALAAAWPGHENDASVAECELFPVELPVPASSSGMAVLGGAEMASVAKVLLSLGMDTHPDLQPGDEVVELAGEPICGATIGETQVVAALASAEAPEPAIDERSEPAGEAVGSPRLVAWVHSSAHVLAAELALAGSMVPSEEQVQVPTDATNARPGVCPQAGQALAFAAIEGQPGAVLAQTVAGGVFCTNARVGDRLLLVNGVRVDQMPFANVLGLLEELQEDTRGGAPRLVFRRAAATRDTATGPTCAICFGPAKLALVPCGHVCLCAEDAGAYGFLGSQQHCPLCRTEVERVVRLFGQ